MGSEDNKLKEEHLATTRTQKMHLNLLFSSTLLCLASGAPQYGGVLHSPAAAPLRGQGTVKCVTQYATIWDTEYTETETEVCTTEYEKVCRTETQRLCVEQFKTEYEPYTETECSTE